MTRATVIIDASFCSKTRSAGWAAWIAYDGGTKGRHSGKFRERPDNSGVAELQADLNGIWIAYQAGVRDILVQSDCTAVVFAVQGKGGYAAAYRAARVTHFPDASIRAKHVRGHTDINDSRSYCNRWADNEAKRHMREQRNQT